MRTPRRTASAAAAVVAAMAAAPAATGAAYAEDPGGTPTLQGTWWQGTEQLTPTTCADTTDVRGRWSVTLKDDGTANLSLTVLIHGRLHAAWGGQAIGPRASWAPTSDGYEITQAAGPFPWTFVVDGDDVTFTVPDRYPGCTPSAGTLRGTVR